MIRSAATRATLSVLALSLLTVAPTEAQDSAPNAKWYLGTYTNEILVWDEAAEDVIDRIETKSPISTRLSLSPDKSQLYLLDPFFETLEIIDLETRTSVADFTLSHDNTRTWINSFEPHPSLEWAAILVQSRTKLADRYEIDDHVILRYDLNAFEVTDTIPWPDDRQRESASFRFSPDGDVMYVFTDDLVALDSESWEEVDRWEISEPFETGLGRMSLPFGTSPYQEENGVYTGMFRMTDPVQDRRIMGIATVDMAAQEVDFRPIGPSEGLSFTLSPDGTKGYGLRSRVGDYQMWKFDVTGARVSDQIRFEGRPRMALMPSADGSRLFIYNAGATIDVYDEQTFELLRTFTFDADMTQVVVVPDRE